MRSTSQTSCSTSVRADADLVAALLCSAVVDTRRSAVRRHRSPDCERTHLRPAGVPPAVIANTVGRAIGVAMVTARAALSHVRAPKDCRSAKSVQSSCGRDAVCVRRRLADRHLVLLHLKMRAARSGFRSPRSQSSACSASPRTRLARIRASRKQPITIPRHRSAAFAARRARADCVRCRAVSLMSRSCTCSCRRS